MLGAKQQYIGRIRAASAAVLMAILITIPSFAEEAGSGALFEEADEAARQPAGARSWFDPSLGLQTEDCAQRTLKQSERAMSAFEGVAVSLSEPSECPGTAKMETRANYSNGRQFVAGVSNNMCYLHSCC